MIFSENLWADGVLGDAYVDKTTYTPTISGGVAFGGTGVAVEITGNYSIIGSGGIAFSGSAQISRGYEPIILGGIDFASSPDITFIANIIGSGGIVFGGLPDISLITDVIGSGGIVFGGDASYTVIRNVISSEGITFGGDALTEQTVEYTYTPPISGTITFSSDDDSIFTPVPLETYSTIGSGGIALSGSSDILTVFNVIGSGGITFGGNPETDNPTDSANPEVVEFLLTIDRLNEIDVIIDRDYEADIQITRSVDFKHVM